MRQASVSTLPYNVLPEIGIEASAEADDDERADDVKGAPALLDALLEVGREGDGIDLSL